MMIFYYDVRNSKYVVLLLCRPFSVVEGEGFREFVRSVIGIGAKYGNVEIDQVLPCATTVSRHLCQVVKDEQTALKVKLSTVPWFGVTTDMWTHEQTNVSYITVTAHFIDSDWRLQGCILATRATDEKHTADCVRVNVGAVLEEFGAARRQNVFVTDNAANMKAAFRMYSWLGCACHNLNLVLTHTFQDKSTNDPDDGVPAEITQIMATCKDLVTLAKRTRLNSQLETTLKQCICTRWNSTLATLKSVSSNLVGLKVLSTEPNANRNLLRLLAEINEQLLADVIKVLDPFDVATKHLSTDTNPSLNVVVPTKRRLEQHLKPLATDSVVIGQIKRLLTDNLERYFPLTPLHYAAALLDPRSKNNANIMSTEEQGSAVAVLHQMITDLTDSPDCTPESTGETSPAAKTVKRGNGAENAEMPQDDFFGDLFASTASSVGNEVKI